MEGTALYLRYESSTTTHELIDCLLQYCIFGDYSYQNETIVCDQCKLNDSDTVVLSGCTLNSELLECVSQCKQIMMY